MNTEPKTAASLLPETLARLERTYGAGREAESTPLPLSRNELLTVKPRPVRKNPLRTEWQRKWLNLEVTSPVIQRAADVVEKWAARFGHHKLTDTTDVDPHKTGHLVIVGDYGIGKTEIAERMLEWARGTRLIVWPKFWPRPPRVEFVEFGSVAFLETEEFKIWLADHTEVNAGTDLMFLEDIGAEVDRYKTGEPTERLREILNAFKSKWLVITTNVPVDQWEERWDGRVQDRLLRNSIVLDLSEAESYQLAKTRLPHPND